MKLTNQRCDPLQPFGIEPTGCVWLHLHCWRAWHADRRAESVAVVSRTLAEMANRLHIAVVAVTHLNKGGGSRKASSCRSAGADGSGAPTGPKNGNYKHGRYTQDVAATRQWLGEASRMLRKLNNRPC